MPLLKQNVEEFNSQVAGRQDTTDKRSGEDGESEKSDTTNDHDLLNNDSCDNAAILDSLHEESIVVLFILSIYLSLTLI